MEIRPFPFTEPDDLVLNPEYLELQRDEPVARVRLPYGGDGWLATRYVDVKTVLADPRFSRAAVMEPGADVPRTLPSMPAEANILSMDPPDHTRLRRLVAKAFTARRTEQLRERAQEIVDGLLDAMEERGAPADLVESLAMPLPITIICEMLGVPFEDRDEFRAWSEAAVAITAFTHEEILASGEALRAYIGELAERKRVDPADDMLSVLVAAHDNEDRLSTQELVSFGVALLVAGHETTANQLGNFAFQLLRDPDRLGELRADPMLVPAAVEELLRFTPLGGSAGFPRIATAEVELSGVTIKPGEAVFVDNLAANRDPSVFENPNELDFHREQNPHITFGHGAHHCIGAPLARMELQVAIGTLIKRFPLLRLDGEVAFKKGRLIRGPQALPVRW
ncbi:cytochrome P450 [Saccharothrix ecbatanensis]|uniref:Cytochrome P450 n=1 Tax=Saccharothrix ecbatanensis TaxID=1105145 RepID=A0A7W9M5I8_9PSEU|nr:cytochrome P450 [Saccharothrix ecbatanensis]MBB5808257.1 cytochrome P450 [Saccharothrix ecbatanensis]